MRFSELENVCRDTGLRPVRESPNVGVLRLFEFRNCTHGPEARVTMTGLKLLLGLMLPVMVLICIAPSAHAAEPSSRPSIDTFNYIIGTQTFSPLYHFTSDTPLVETAKAIAAMGSNLIKFRMKREYFIPPKNDVPN